MVKILKNAVILDRDGVINLDSKSYIKSAAEWQPIPESLEAIVRLQKADFKVYMATNQSGIGRGLYSEAVLHQMHAKMHHLLFDLGGREFDGIFYCPHHPDQSCECRKPKPGLLTAIAQKHNVDLTTAFFVGDSAKDLEAARAVGAQGVLVLTGNGLITEKFLENPVPIFANLSQFVESLLSVK